MLDQPIQYLKGVGPKRSKLLERMGIITLRDLAGYFPREYDDRRKTHKIVTAPPGQKIALSATVEACEVITLKPSLAAFKAALTDGTGVAFAVFFRKHNPYHRHDIFATLKKDFAKGNHVFVYGTVEAVFGQKEIAVEEYETFSPALKDHEILHFNRIVTVYPLTEGIQQKWFRELVCRNIDALEKEWPDILPQDMADVQKLAEMPGVLKEIHFPSSSEGAETARKRLAFDEFLLLETALSIVRRDTAERTKPRDYSVARSLLTPFKEKLGFTFTAAQKKVINEIFNDMQGKRPMNRLLMGDVGSGKTVVALSALLLAIENNFQAALLAPTEILAEQHYITVRRMLEGLPVRTALLTGKLSAKKKEKQALLSAAARGEIDLVIGTHALIEKGVAFKNLSLIVIDEQHRFGVLQRAALAKKTTEPDVLVMTATPIPRTLALTLYGDLDVSVIDTLPPGRLPVRTMHLEQGHAYSLVRGEIRKGRQAFIVYPLVEESDKVALKAAVRESETLSQTVFKDMRVGLLHGQMNPAEKEQRMIDFRGGAYDVLIATTVIEVGIDIPNATVMVNEHADRFGLATLHQLRGRIGRGKDESFCVLLGNPKSDDAKKRLEVMLKTTDGFVVAEEDLALRGPGEFFGTAQHGMPPLKAGNIITDLALIEQAKAAAAGVVAEDPALRRPANGPLRAELLRLYKNRLGLSIVL